MMQALSSGPLSAQIFAQGPVQGVLQSTIWSIVFDNRWEHCHVSHNSGPMRNASALLASH